jgi:hypothetical protein
VSREPEDTSGPGFLVVLALLALALQFILVCLATGCAHSGPPPAPPLTFDAPPCPDPQPEPVDTDVCEGLTTTEGLQCVRCEVDRGCVLTSAAVYCTPACADGACAFGSRR